MTGRNIVMSILNTAIDNSVYHVLLGDIIVINATNLAFSDVCNSGKLIPLQDMDYHRSITLSRVIQQIKKNAPFLGYINYNHNKSAGETLVQWYNKGE